MKNVKLFGKVSEMKKMIIAGSLAGVMLFSVGCKDNSNNQASSVSKPSHTVTQDVEAEEQIVLTAENIDEEVAKIVESDSEKGLSISEDKVKSALFITNIDNLSTEDIYTIFGYKLDGIDNDNTRLKVVAEEIQNMYDYVSAVRTHNNNGNEYISMAQLVYNNATDKSIIEELDAEYLELVKKLSDGTITEEEYQKSFKYVTEFYTGAGYINAEENYSNYSLTAGGGLLSEAYWPMFAVAYSSSNLLTKENKIDIKTLSEGTNNQPAVVNGSKYLGSIINMAESCTNSLEETKHSQNVN